jgi:predicted nucleic acid-binding protein
MNLVDTSGWLEYFSDSANAPNYEGVISQIDQLIVPTIVIYEVFKKIACEFDEDKALTAIAHMKLANVIDMNETIAIYAAKISLEKKLPMADSIIFATAEIYGATLYTQDEHFSKLANVKYFTKK